MSLFNQIQYLMVCTYKIDLKLCNKVVNLLLLFFCLSKNALQCSMLLSSMISTNLRIKQILMLVTTLKTHIIYSLSISVQWFPHIGKPISTNVVNKAKPLHVTFLIQLTRSDEVFTFWLIQCL